MILWQEESLEPSSSNPTFVEHDQTWVWILVTYFGYLRVTGTGHNQDIHQL